MTLLLECKCKHFLCFHEFRLWHENAGFVSACNLSVKSFWGQDLVNIRSELYLVLCDLLCDLGCLSSHGLSWAQPSLSGAQPFSQWLQRFVELKSQNLQFLQLPLPRRQKEGVVVFQLFFYAIERWFYNLMLNSVLIVMTFIIIFFKNFFFSLKGHLCAVENYLAPALSSKSAHLSASLWSWVSILSLSAGSAVAAILSPSAWIISTVGRRSSNSLWRSCRWRKNKQRLKK